jgi:hypothetical protein
MACVLLLRPPGPAVTAVPCTAGLRDRLAARWSVLAADRALAAGAPADHSAVLTLRAQRLLDPARRARLAGDLERALARAGADVPAAAVLAARLRAHGPVDPAGVARARLLLVDAASPLHATGAGGALAATVEATAAALVPA